jgi:hypothetical protein
MDPLIIPICALAIPIIVVPVALGLKHARLLRELEHAERMKALELGRTLPQDETWWNPSRICVAIGAGVPIAAVCTAWWTTAAVGFHEEVWILSGMVGIASVISGSALAAKHFAHQARDGNITHDLTKPRFDADAYDVVSTRG